MSTATVNNYSLGTDVICSVVFKNLAGVAADPTAVFFTVKDPEGTSTTYTYGTGEIVKDSTGNYHVKVDASKSGTWCYRFYSTGTGKAAAEDKFTVDRSNF